MELGSNRKDIRYIPIERYIVSKMEMMESVDKRDEWN